MEFSRSGLTWATTFLTAILVSACPAFCQRLQPKVYDLTKPAPRVGPLTPVPKSGSPTNKPKTSTPKFSPAEQRRRAKILARLIQQAAEIERLTGTAFQRSLLNLEDYGEALDVSLQLRLAATKDSPDADALKRQAFRLRAARLQAAAQATAQLQQRGAIGWASETALGKMQATNAAADLAKARGDKASWANLAAQSQQNAARLLQFRQADYRLGLADDRQMLSAVKATNGHAKANADEVRLKQLHNTLQTHVQRMQSLQQKRAGNTRPEELHSVRAQLQTNAARMELAAGRTTFARSAWLKAEREYEQEFRSLLDLQKKGTAGLCDLVRNWRHRTEIQSALVKAGFEVPAANRGSRLSDLKRMMQIAESTTDRRGRIGGDVAIIQGLSLLEQAHPLPHKPASPEKTKSPATVQPQVVDVKSDLQNRPANVKTGVSIRKP